MADSNAPFSVRMDQEDKQKLVQLIQESGKSNKEFMSVLLSAYELNKTKVEIPEIAEDLKGLEALTKQINDYYVNIGKRIENIQKSKDIEFTKETEVYKNRIEVLKAENDKLNVDYEGLQQSYNNINIDYEECKKQLEQLQQSLKDKTLLVEEYKEKNDTMTGLLNEYKQYKTEVEEYKKILADSQAKNIELNNSIKNKDSMIEKLNDEIVAVNQAKETTVQELNSKHDEVIETIKEKAEIQKDKAILALKAQYQQELQEIQNKYNESIQEYQTKYKQLLQELEQTKKVTHKRPTDKGTPKGAK
jgi:chromosome segregation ATPase